MKIFNREFRDDKHIVFFESARRDLYHTFSGGFLGNFSKSLIFENQLILKFLAFFRAPLKILYQISFCRFRPREVFLASFLAKFLVFFQNRQIKYQNFQGFKKIYYKTEYFENLAPGL